MTESKAIELFRERLTFIKEHYTEEVKDYEQALETGIQALEIVKKLSDRKITTETLENYMQFEDECVKKGFTFKSVIEARNKQMAKEPIAHQCVTCGNALLPFEGNYCSKCGQKIDWGDNN